MIWKETSMEPVLFLRIKANAKTDPTAQGRPTSSGTGAALSAPNLLSIPQSFPAEFILQLTQQRSLLLRWSPIQGLAMLTMAWLPWPWERGILPLWDVTDRILPDKTYQALNEFEWGDHGLLESGLDGSESNCPELFAPGCFIRRGLLHNHVAWRELQARKFCSRVCKSKTKVQDWKSF